MRCVREDVVNSIVVGGIPETTFGTGSLISFLIKRWKGKQF